MKDNQYNLEEHGEAYQAFFDKTAIHLLTQNKKSMIGYPFRGFDSANDPHKIYRCAYRGEEGSACAIGAHIPDEDYDKGMEDRSVMELMREDSYHLWKRGRPPESLTNFINLHKGAIFFMRGLQNIHDSDPPEIWVSRLIDLAISYGLKYDHIPGME